MAKVKIKLFKSPIGSKQEHKRTVRALGLKKLNSTAVHELNPAVQGMIKSVCHLVKIEEKKQ